MPWKAPRPASASHGQRAHVHSPEVVRSKTSRCPWSPISSQAAAISLHHIHPIHARSAIALGRRAIPIEPSAGRPDGSIPATRREREVLRAMSRHDPQSLGLRSEGGTRRTMADPRARARRRAVAVMRADARVGRQAIHADRRSCSKPCSRSMRVPTAPQAEAGQIGTARSLIAHRVDVAVTSYAVRGEAGPFKPRPPGAPSARCRQPSSRGTTRHAATAGRAHFAARRRATMRPLRASRPRSEAGPAPPPSRTPHRATPRGRRRARPTTPARLAEEAHGRATALSSGTRRPRQGAASADRGLAFRPRQQRQLRVAFLSSRA